MYLHTSGFLIYYIPIFYNKKNYAVLGAAGLFPFLGRLLPYEPLIILPRRVLLSPFPIVVD